MVVYVLFTDDFIGRLLTSGLILGYNNRGSNPRLRPGYDCILVCRPLDYK